MAAEPSTNQPPIPRIENVGADNAALVPVLRQILEQSARQTAILEKLLAKQDKEALDRLGGPSAVPVVRDADRISREGTIASKPPGWTKMPYAPVRGEQLPEGEREENVEWNAAAKRVRRIERKKDQGRRIRPADQRFLDRWKERNEDIFQQQEEVDKQAAEKNAADLREVDKQHRKPPEKRDKPPAQVAPVEEPLNEADEELRQQRKRQWRKAQGNEVGTVDLPGKPPGMEEAQAAIAQPPAAQQDNMSGGTNAILEELKRQSGLLAKIADRSSEGVVS